MISIVEIIINVLYKSIALHDNGRSHKDEVERFLRGVYQKGRKDIEDKANVQQELERIERVGFVIDKIRSRLSIL